MITKQRKRENFIERAVDLSYYKVVNDVNEVPFFEEIMDALPKHLRQELYLEITITQRHGAIGVKSDKELEYQIASGKLNHLMPKSQQVMEILNEKGLTYIHFSEGEYHNSPIVGVW